MYNGSSLVVSMNSTVQGSSPWLHPEARLAGVVSVSTTGIAEEGCWEMLMGWGPPTSVYHPCSKPTGCSSVTRHLLPGECHTSEDRVHFPSTNTQPSQPHCEFMSHIENQRADIVNLNTASQIRLKDKQRIWTYSSQKNKCQYSWNT